jgi:hypothetical protein
MDRYTNDSSYRTEKFENPHGALFYLEDKHRGGNPEMTQIMLFYL